MAKANKAPAKMISFLKLPEAVTKSVPLDQLTFDRTLQHRSKLTDEETVKEYAEFDAAGTAFPPLKAVHQSVDENGAKCNVYWVYDGFQRGGAYRANKREKCQVEVIEGDYEDAYFLSLSSNREHGLNRTSEDKKRAVFALLDNPKALELVLSKAKGNGGAHRVIGAACGCSAAWVDEALKARDLIAKGDKLVKRRATPTAPPPLTPDAALVPVTPTVNPPVPVDPEAQRAADDKYYQEMCEQNFLDRVNEAAGRAKRIAVLISTMMTDPNNGKMVREIMAAQGLSVSGEFDVRAKEEGKDFRAYYEILELWPVSVKLGNLFAAIKKAHEAKSNPAPAPATEPAQEGEATPAPSEPSSNGKTPAKGKKDKKSKATKEPAATA